MGERGCALPTPAATPPLLCLRELREEGSACRGRGPMPQFPSLCGVFWGCISCSPSLSCVGSVTPLSHIFWGHQGTTSPFSHLLLPSGPGAVGTEMVTVHVTHVALLSQPGVVVPGQLCPVL